MIRNVILLMFAATLVLMTLRSLRRHRLKERYVILFLLTSLPFTILAVWPGLLGRIAEWMNMPYHTLMVILLAVYLLLLIFKLLSIVSIQERKIADLAQELAILRLGSNAQVARTTSVLQSPSRQQRGSKESDAK